MDGGAAGGGQDFRLTWVNYSQKLSEAFNKFLSRETLCNVTLSVNRRSIKAHQAILSACSPWFEDVLMENQHPHPIIIIKDVKYEDIRNIIRFIYTGEVSIPQHELQDFLRTAELLEIKGLLKSPTATAAAAAAAGGHQHQPIEHHHHAEHGIHLNAITPPPPPPPPAAVHQISQPQLPTVPVSSILLGPAAATGTPVAPPSTVAAACHITDGGIDLVSQIKVPVSIPATAATALSPMGGAGKKRRSGGGGPFSSACKYSSPHHHHHHHHHQQPVVLTAKRRNIAGNATVLVNDGHGLSVVTASAAHHHHGHEAHGVDGAEPAVAQLLETAAEDETVTWMPDADDQVTEETVVGHAGAEGVPLTPAQAIANGVSDCGAFKRIWAERYLCYNLGREIICLLCFCRFTQFKKFNLERHMKNKHAQLYNLSESTRKLILDRYVSRYEAHVTPSMVASVPSHGNEHMASEIMAVGPIQLDDLNLEDAEEVVGVANAEAETAAAAALELVEEEEEEEDRKAASPPPPPPPPVASEDAGAAGMRLSVKSEDDDRGEDADDAGDEGGRQMSPNDGESSPRGLSQEPPPHPPSSSDTRPGGSRETTLVDKRENVQGEDNESRRGGGGRGGCDDRGGGGDGGSPVDNPVDPQLIVELEETEEDIVSTLQVKEEKEMF